MLTDETSCLDDVAFPLNATFSSKVLKRALTYSLTTIMVYLYGVGSLLWLESTCILTSLKTFWTFVTCHVILSAK